MAEYTTLEQVKIRLKQFHIDSKSDSERSEVVFDHLEEDPLFREAAPYINSEDQMLLQQISRLLAQRKQPQQLLPKGTVSKAYFLF